MLAKNKKGISEIVVTVIIILLAIVAFAVISVVVRGTVSSGAENIELSSNCLEVEMHADKITRGDAATVQANGYPVTVSRSASGKALDGVKIIIEDENSSISSNDIIETIKPLDKKVYSVPSGEIYFNLDQIKVTVVPFFMKKSGELFYCENTQTDELVLEFKA